MRVNRTFPLLATVVLCCVSPALRAQNPPSAAPPPPPPTAQGAAAASADKPQGDALAQEAESKPDEPKEKDQDARSPWSGHFAAGFNFTRGNSDTSSLNLSLVAQYDPGTKNLVKADAFYIHNVESGTSSTDRSSAHLRDERNVSPAWFAYGDAQYIKDRFKEIVYFVNPTVGVGYRLLDQPSRKAQVDAGVGGVVERDEGEDRRSSGALRVGEETSFALSKTAVLTNRGFALLASGGDAFYYLDLGIGAEISEHFELKVALIDQYKRKPPADVVSNDLAGIVSVGYKL